MKFLNESRLVQGIQPRRSATSSDYKAALYTLASLALLRLTDLHELLAAILAALGANTVAQNSLAAIRADNRIGRVQSVMRASVSAASFGGAFLWYWHGINL